MRIGFRSPSLKRSIRARTTGRIKRAMKKTTRPFYGKKGIGFVKSPKRAVKNALYRRTTFGLRDIMRWFK